MISRDAIRQPSTLRLRMEFALFFFAAPVALALLLPPTRMFPMLFSVTAIGLLLLCRTPDFRWRDLLEGWQRVAWGSVVAIGAATLLFGAAFLWATRPGDMFQLLRYRPLLMLVILVLYPLVSALPQELIYRALFFRRYSGVLPWRPGLLVPANAAFFAFAHLMYWSWLVLLMTFLGGLAFAWAYRVRRSFPMALILHATAGNAIFLVGLGSHFYSGNVVRPF